MFFRQGRQNNSPYRLRFLLMRDIFYLSPFRSRDHEKRILALLIITVCALMLASCGCEHEWAEASCLTPKTCTLCEQTEGEATGHAWQPADCINPETCSHCGEQRGAALGHEWQAATCENDEVCTLCQEVNTLAFGHSFGTWEGSDEAFMHICQTCGKEESMTPEACFLQQLTGTWQAKLYFTGGWRNWIRSIISPFTLTEPSI